MSKYQQQKEYLKDKINEAQTTLDFYVFQLMTLENKEMIEELRNIKSKSPSELTNNEKLKIKTVFDKEIKERIKKGIDQHEVYIIEREKELMIKIMKS